MRNLILTGIQRYFRRPLTYICLVASLFSGVMYAISSVYTDAETPSFHPDDFSWIISIFVNIVLLVLNIGTEFSAGAFRNKLIAGYSKQNLYLSETVLALLLSSVMFCLTALPFAVCRFEYLSKMNNLPLAFGSIFAAYVFIGILPVLFCFVSANRTAAAIFSLLLTFGLYFTSYSLEHKLNAPEYYTIYYYADGSSMHVTYGDFDAEDMNDVTEVKKEPNPDYIGGTKRTVLTFLNDCNSFTAIRSFSVYGYYTNNFMTNELPAYEEENRPQTQRALVSTCMAGAVLTTVGAWIFKKKNLR